jgi:hypothetical protein
MTTDLRAAEAREAKAVRRSMQQCGVAAGFSPIIAGLLAKKVLQLWNIVENVECKNTA